MTALLNELLAQSLSDSRCLGFAQEQFSFLTTNRPVLALQHSCDS